MAAANPFGIEQAEEAEAKQGPNLMVRLPLRDQADAEIEPIVIEVGEDRAVVECPHGEADARGLPLKEREEPRDEIGFDAAWHGDGEGPLDGRGIEVILAEDDRLELARNAPLTGSTRADARGVSRMPSDARVRSSSPSSFRRRARLLLIADWLRPTCTAARVTLRSVSIASSATRRFKSILARSECLIVMPPDLEDGADVATTTIYDECRPSAKRSHYRPMDIGYRRHLFE